MFPQYKSDTYREKNCFLRILLREALILKEYIAKLLKLILHCHFPVLWIFESSCSPSSWCDLLVKPNDIQEHFKWTLALLMKWGRDCSGIAAVHIWVLAEVKQTVSTTKGFVLQPRLVMDAHVVRQHPQSVPLVLVHVWQHLWLWTETACLLLTNSWLKGIITKLPLNGL